MAAVLENKIANTRLFVTFGSFGPESIRIDTIIIFLSLLSADILTFCHFEKWPPQVSQVKSD